ncbi:MAG: hypothetical protein WC069_06460 [Candidatus Shapirobacteria bacterium]|nr:hypothetical protein [Terrimicrobiaceae bacterium]
MGGGSQPVTDQKAVARQQQNEFKQWQLAMDTQRQMQNDQIAAQERMAAKQAAAEAAQLAEQEQLRQAELRKADEAAAKKQSDAAAQAAAQQASGASASIDAVNAAKLAAAAQTAPGLSPYKAAIADSGKVGNAFYAPDKLRFGGQ